MAEIKVPAKLLDAQGHPLNLATEYAFNAHVKSMVDQAFSHMAVLRVHVGYVTGHDVMNLLERPEDNPSILCISKAIMLQPGSSSDADSPTTLAAMAWAQHKGLLQARLPPPQLLPLSSWARAQHQLSASGNIVTPISTYMFADGTYTTLSQCEGFSHVGTPSNQAVKLEQQQQPRLQQKQRQQQQHLGQFGQ